MRQGRAAGQITTRLRRGAFNAAAPRGRPRSGCRAALFRVARRSVLETRHRSGATRVQWSSVRAAVQVIASGLRMLFVLS